MKIFNSNTLIILLLFVCSTVYSQNLGALIPTNTATHTAVQEGSWFDGSTWDTETVPGDGAIVVIPSGITVHYSGQSSAHIFAIRVDGVFNCTQTNNSLTTTLTVDTFVGTMMSTVKFLASATTDGKIDVSISPFDIEAHKAGTSGYSQTWNSSAMSHYSDGKTTYEVTKTIGNNYRYKTHADALAANTTVTETSRNVISDGPGVLGRHEWDPDQVSIGIALMGQVEIIGKQKLGMSKLSIDALSGQNKVVLSTTPTGWEEDDTIVISSGGNKGASNNGEDVSVIDYITDKTITCTSNLLKNHQGRAADNLHCYVGNLTRNITFRSTDISQVHRRGHFMAMHNDINVQVRNAAFVDMGRTDKSKLLDDFIWDEWVEPKTFKSFSSPLGQECVKTVKNPVNEITNSRGRYSIHLHHTGSVATSSMTYVTGNVVWGNPGWGITHHDANATISDNVVYDVTGAGIVSEAGNETGVWEDNLVIDVKKGHSESPYRSVITYEDYLFSGQGLGLKGRAVVCKGNVIVNAKQGVGVMNMNPVSTNQVRMDAAALAQRPGYEVDNFPLSVNGYSSEGDGVMPQEVALIMENTTVINTTLGLKSIEREMGVNHESRSVFDGFYAWGVNQGLSITYQADYTFKDVFISGKNSNAIGAYLWKHAHNHTFENIKMVDLGYGIQVSKLVENNDGSLKTRNNGFTPWIFVNLTTENVTKLYKIEKEDPGTPENYVEHGDNSIILNTSDITTRPTTFTILDDSTLEVDYATNDFKFEVDGIITDDFGSYNMGIRQALAQGTLRQGYPTRIYEFASQAKFEEYLTVNGVYKDATTNELYFIINENLPNRRTYAYTSFPVRVNIKNAPSSGVFASPQTESPAALAPKLEMISRLGTVTQSSTDTSLSYGDVTSIDAGAHKAVDGNNNGRINAEYYQQRLVSVGSISSTNVENEPWFDLDLGEIKEIEFIDLWNSVELKGEDIETPSPHFKDFYVLISDTPFGTMDLTSARNIANYEYLKDGTPSRKFSLNNLGATGRYIRIQAIGSTKIKLAEVEVIGKSIASPTIPDEPTLLEVAEETCTSIKLTWNDASNNETGFKIMQSINGSAYTLYHTTEEDIESYTATGLDENTEYGFRVKAYNEAGNSAAARTDLITTSTCPTVPNAPLVFEATEGDCNSINLDWTDNSDNEDGFEILQSTDGGINYISIHTTAENIISYSVTGLEENTEYSFRVEAYNEAGNSAAAQVNKTTSVCPTVPIAPTMLPVTKVECTSIDIAWSDNSDNEDGFKLFRSVDGGAYELYQTLAADVTSFSATGLTESTSYGFKVIAYNNIGDSVPSESITSTTLACQSSTTLAVVHDAHVRNGSYKNDNFGSASSLQIRQKNGNGLKRYGYLMFDVSTVSNITSATLRFYNTGSNGTVNIYEVDDDNWNENNITWNNKPSIGNYITNVSFNGNGFYDVDVTNFVINEKSAEDDNKVTLGIKGSTDNYMTISSKEGTNAPVLIINGSASGAKNANTKETLNVVSNELIEFASVYPNPTSGSLTVHINDADIENGTITIYDSIGRLIQKIAVTNEKMKIQLKNKSGIYFVRIQNKGILETKKIIKK
ncbi:DNRLRE domain-containing protein [Polaribacter aestuariivivens]|uniref:DNRLRE domain-containing protein n=1 Tax=Polaribacter aestuariivivens TaxID=2304626 RepID=A0A5S3N443_9FLAO|nr:DNRLRE domain-containing protein [Polaribacter aestuariivivens]TMM30030.1 DNRLRE domain-containing protein [Polaribacter aestuariivivens]